MTGVEYTVPNETQPRKTIQFVTAYGLSAFDSKDVNEHNYCDGCFTVLPKSLEVRWGALTGRTRLCRSIARFVLLAYISAARVKNVAPTTSCDTEEQTKKESRVNLQQHPLLGAFEQPAYEHAKKKQINARKNTPSRSRNLRAISSCVQCSRTNVLAKGMRIRTATPFAPLRTDTKSPASELCTGRCAATRENLCKERKHRICKQLT